MKHWTLQIMAVCAAGLIAPALAQTSTNEMPDDSGNPSMQSPDGSPPADMSAGQADENAASEPPPASAQSASPPPVQLVGPRPAAQGAQAQSRETAGGSSQQAQAANNTPVVSAFMPPEEGAPSNPDQLRLNFRDVPLNMVLNYLSDAAGFIIVIDTQVHGNVSVISSHPMTRDEAVDLLNSVLNQNGYAAIRNGRTLTIVDKNEAKTRDIPVQVGNNPAGIPKNDVIVTQIIPVRYVDASQLVTDLASFVSPQATIVANQAGNSIVITDTQENIRHLVEIISAIDSSAAGETEIRVFPLAFANPNDVATELGQIFPSGNSGNGLSPIAFRGGLGGGGFGGGGGPGGFFARMAAVASGNNNNSGNRAQKQSQVTAVADPRTQSIIVMASKDLMQEIAGMVQQLDVPSTRDQKVYVYHMNNGDPQEALQVLQGMFPQNNNNSRNTASSQQTENSALVQRANQNATTVGQTSSQLSSGSGNGTSRGLGSGGGGAQF